MNADGEPPNDPGGGFERDRMDEMRFEQRVKDSMWKRLLERMRRAWKRRGDTAMRMLFMQTNRAEREHRLHATMLQTRVRLRGTGWRPTVAIWDTGSPFTLVKNSCVIPQLVEQTKTTMKWGTAGVSRPMGEVEVTIGLTKKTQFDTRAIVVPDHELPTYVDALIGNDVILRVTHANRTDARKAKQWLEFDNDDERVELVSTREGIRELVHNFVSENAMTDLLTFHATNAATKDVLKTAAIEQRPAMDCNHGCCTVKHAADASARNFAVLAAQTVVIPPASQRIIVGRLEGSEIDGVQLEDDSTAVFFPHPREDCVMWTAEFEICKENPDPWLPIRVCNTMDVEVRLKSGENLGEAYTDAQIMRFTTSSGASCHGEECRNSGGHKHDGDDDEERKEMAMLTQGVESASSKEEFRPTYRAMVEERRKEEEERREPLVMTDAFAKDESNYDVATLVYTHAGGLHGDECSSDWATKEETTPLFHVQHAEDEIFSASGPGYLTGGGETDVEREKLFIKSGIVSEEKAAADFAQMVAAVRSRLRNEKDVSPRQAEAAAAVLERNRRMFIEPNLAREDHADYPFYLRIPTTTETPVNIPPYRYPADKLAALHAWADAQLEKGHIEHATSAWNAPIVLARKKDGRWRFAIDLRGLNRIATFDPYPLPRIPDLMELTHGARWFSALDLTDGYWNCLVHEADRDKLSFTVPGKGRFRWRSVPFGYHGSGPHFQRAVEACMAGLEWNEVAVYVDDLLMFTKDFDQHVRLVDTVLSKLADGGFAVAPNKCSFFVKEIPYLGHLLSQRGVSVQPELVEKIVTAMGTLKSKTAVRRALGVAQFYARFIWDFSGVVSPLSDATKKHVHEDLGNLSEEERAAMEQAAQRLQKLMLSAPTLALPDYSKEFVLVTDASDVGMGAMLAQEEGEGHLRPVAFWSRKLSPTERAYSATEREALAVVFFVEKFRHYLLGRRFLLQTDHAALKFIFQGAANNSKLARWALKLQEFCFDIVHIAGKDNVVADELSRRDFDGSALIEEWNVSRDKGMYVRGPGVPDGEAIVPLHRIPLEEVQERVFAATDDRKIGFANLQREDDEAAAMRRWVAGMSTDVPLAVEERDRERWRRKVTKCTQHKELEERDGVLVRVTERRNQSDVLEATRERVVAPKSIRRMILADAHDASWAGHFAESKTRDRIERRWWWPTLREDVARWVRSCDECAQAGRGKKQLYGKLHALRPTLRPFERIAIDTVDVVTVGQSEYRACLTVVDYCTRYALAIPLRDKTAATIAQALVDRVVGYFGPPEEILSDNAGDLRGVVSELARAIGTHQRFTTTYHPRANGLVERFNQTFLGMMRTVLDDHRHSHWERFVAMAQYAYNSAPHSGTGYAPHLLLFGQEPVSPLEAQFDWPSSFQAKDEWVQRLLEIRNEAHRALEKTQEQQKERYDKKRREADFQVGDRVFLEVGAIPRGANVKTYNRYRGPYRVVKFKEGDTVVDLQHANIPDETVRVSVERVIRVNTEPMDRLSPLERKVLDGWAAEQRQVAAEERPAPKMAEVPKDKEEMDDAKGGLMEEPLVRMQSPAQERPADGHYDLKTIHIHRIRPGDEKKDPGERRTEFLVEYRMPKGSREGHWCDEEDVDAPELVADYWRRLERNELVAVPNWKKKCRWNGYDSGCLHLQCKADSWRVARDAQTSKQSKKIDPRVPLGGAIKKKEIDRGVAAEQPTRTMVNTRSGRNATRVQAGVPMRSRK